MSLHTITATINTLKIGLNQLPQCIYSEISTRGFTIHDYYDKEENVLKDWDSMANCADWSGTRHFVQTLQSQYFS